MPHVVTAADCMSMAFSLFAVPGARTGTTAILRGSTYVEVNDALAVAPGEWADTANPASTRPARAGR
jgi:hypothetical protein